MGVPIFHFHGSNIKRTAILEKAMYSSPFLCKRKLTELFAAHETPVCLRHSHTANKTGIATHRVTLSTATPKRPAAESSVSKILCIPAQPGKQRDTVCLHAPQTTFPSRNKAFKKRGSPSHRNMTLSVRKASFTGFSIAELHFCCTKIVIF